MDNVNDIFFDGHYKDIWRSIIPTELTSKEVDFILKYFELSPGSKVLDIMCGYGRHALGLARNGIEVEAVDNLGYYIDEIKDIAESEKIPVKAVRSGVIDYKPTTLFDLAICMGNSLNFFTAEDTNKLLSSISSSLKKGGHLLINTWSLAEISIKQFTSKSWDFANDLRVLSDSQYLFHPTRIETITTFIAPDGKTESKKAVDYIFSVAELEAMLNIAGFSIKTMYSIPGKKKFTLGDPRAYIIALKNH